MTSPKIIMVPFSGKDSELGALETAAELARKWNAHIEVWHLASDPHSSAVAVYSVYGLGLAYVPDALLADIEKQNKAALQRAQKKYARFLRIMQISEVTKASTGAEPTASFHMAKGRADLILRTQARLADMVVISRGYTDELDTSDNIVTDIAFHSGKPVLLVPAGKQARPLGDKTLIAWNGSLQATRAVSAAMPLLQSGKVLIASEMEKAGKFPLSAHELAAYLEHHSIAAKVSISRDKDEKAAVALISKAKNFGAGLIVMGAFTHTRAREAVFGGVTKHMLKKATLPVLFAH